ncbi:L-aspartate oxidase [Altibacter lentus]|uniref:L-aspartate oxidase n=1 Tax=Altibacter lentus TaxID=1223410 RepID=UPI0005595299|nr:L-aspartate oxidase [Altibacter lentus]
MTETQYLIIGSGVAGLSLAIKLAGEFPERTVTIVTKSHVSESNTKYAQGGVAAVFNAEVDSFKEHIHDTLVAGDGLCDTAVVARVIEEGPKRLRELMDWGVRFDTDPQGNFALGKEGGHSASRVLHHKDTTGSEIERALLDRVRRFENIRILAHHFAIDLITHAPLPGSQRDTTQCYGAYVLDEKTGEIITVKANSVTLATGGVGKVYGHTTNPAVATGDGIAMAYRAKACIRDMEFIQFHPTALYEGHDGASFLISEAVRGFGAYLRNSKGERFMRYYDDREELASRDIVARAIDSEIKASKVPYVYLDCTHLDIEAFRHEFPNIYKACGHKQIAIWKDWIPVVPAAHYVCGGIVVDRWGRTSVRNLFACGENSRTGLHGANRLASNSLLEAVVYAHRIYSYHCKHTIEPSTVALPGFQMEKGPLLKGKLLQKTTEKLQQLMRTQVGIVRSTSQLEKAKEDLAQIHEITETLYRDHSLHTALCELRNMVTVAHLIITHSLERTVNKGGYFNIDYSESNKTKKHV